MLFALADEWRRHWWATTQHPWTTNKEAQWPARSVVFNAFDIALIWCGVQYTDILILLLLLLINGDGEIFIL